jgi:hypothetical protein
MRRRPPSLPRLHEGCASLVRFSSGGATYLLACLQAIHPARKKDVQQNSKDASHMSDFQLLEITLEGLLNDRLLRFPG